MIIKVCGMRDGDNIRQVEALRPDWMGFIFWPKSSRYVSERPAYLPKECKRVGVFVDPAIEDIPQLRRIADDFALDIVQLHGHESPDFIRALRAEGCFEAVVKAFNIATAADLEATKAYEGLADYFLFDTKAQLPGGSGQQFDWHVLAGYASETPFLLSGGIGPDDAQRIRDFHHPRCIGIDLNSRFELAPGLKDVAALSRFFRRLK